ncbi:MAG TPA: flagellar basal body rod protein FlgB [Burkholderiales bacterium]|nr:flagellar basal body rod protein FlgB [Burkholderiales bacterium]
MNKLDELLNFNHQALNLRAYRQQVLASNIANADTPGYKARDIDFKSALAAASAKPAIPESGEATPAAAAAQPELLYRSVIQPSIDGNTVDMDMERAQFAENTVHYESNIASLTHHIRMMLAAIQG